MIQAILKINGTTKLLLTGETVAEKAALQDLFKNTVHIELKDKVQMDEDILLDCIILSPQKTTKVIES